MDFASSQEYPLIKHAVIALVGELFDELGKDLSMQSAHFQGEQWKITRGENYQHMPYVVLDYPQIKSAEFPVLMRTFFWWGNYFSFNLLIRKDLILQEKIAFIHPVAVLQNENLWNNDLSVDYKIQQEISPHELTGPYLRIAQSIPIGDYDQLGTGIALYNDWMDAAITKKRSP